MLNFLMFTAVWVLFVGVVTAAVYVLLRRHERRQAERTRLDLMKDLFPPKDAA